MIATITVTNRIDQVLAERGFIPDEEVRSCTLDNVLVDTGATVLCLPAAIISQLGLVQGGEASVETTAGIKLGRIFRDVELCIGDRRGTFDCLELTEVDYPLLGVTPMEILGLEPDLKNRKLRVLPMNSEAFLPQHFVTDSRAINSFLAPATIHQRGLLTGHICLVPNLTQIQHKPR